MLLHEAKCFTPVRLATVMLVAAFVRIVPAMFFRRGAAYEMHLFATIGGDALAGENVLMRLPYLPMQVYWMAFSEWLVRNVGMEFTFWFKLPAITADVLMVGLLRYFIVAGDNPAGLSKGLWLYALNPITILVSGYHGQFDTIPLFFLMLSMLVLQNQGSDWKVLWLSSGCLGFGILSKTWPGILLPNVLVRRFSLKKKLGYLIGSSVVPLVGILIGLLLFGGGLAMFFRIARRSLAAGSIPGWWGYTGIINTLRWITGMAPHDFGFLASGKVFLVLPLVGVVIWLTRNEALDFSVFLSLLTIFVTAPGLGLQSLCWLMIYWIWRQDWKVCGIYGGLSLLHMLVSYWGIHFVSNLPSGQAMKDLVGIIQASVIPIWIYCVIIWGKMLRPFLMRQIGWWS